ncbi:MAG: RNA polymerase factor sigma-54 [Planctomycetota bacterium]|jgi:RNA polymerase sigma-54 factor
MRLELGLQHRLEQRLKLAPQIIQSIEILQLPLLELDRLIKQELEENPVLEIKELPPEEKSKEEKEKEKEADKDGEYEKLAELEGDWPDYFGQGRVDKGSLEKDKKLEAMQNTAARPVSLQEFLFQQFNLLNVSPVERKIGEKIIFNIDDNGYLQYPLEEVFDFESDGATRHEVEQVLLKVQNLDPPGVGGRDTVEVLLLQLDPNDPTLLTKEKLIRNHLDDLHKNRLPRVAKAMNLSIDDVKRLISEISILNPRPGALYSNEAPQYIIPDIIVEMINGEYIIRLEDRYVPSLRISGMYRRLLRDKSNDVTTLEFIRKKIESARWLIESIQQRQNTLYRVAVEIFRVQRGFLDHGITRLTPLKMQTVADALSIHVSTVSRAIAEKYAQTHRGIYPLKFFFSGGTTTSEGKDLSRVTVKNKVKEIIDREDRAKPLSDEEVAERLKGDGLNVARRTVTKYRKMLGIPSSRQRKTY